MSKFNTCEREHEDIEGFFAAVAEEGSALRIAEALGATRVVRLARTPSIADLVTGTIPLCEDDSQSLLQEKAASCASAIIAGTCTQYQLAENESLIAFEIVLRGGNGYVRQ